MAKKKAAEPTAEVPAEIAPEAPAEKMTQREAVEMALKAGKDSPTDGVAYVKEKFDITLNNGAFSTIKSKIKNSGDTPAKKPGRPAASTLSASSVNNGKAPAGGSSSVGKAANAAELALAVKTLVKQYGAEAVADMTKVFAD